MIEKRIIEELTECKVHNTYWDLSDWYYATCRGENEWSNGRRVSNIYELDDMFQTVLAGYIRDFIDMNDYRIACNMVGYIMKHYYNCDVIIRSRYFAYRLFNIGKKRSIHDII